jgi:hypothetical protein
MKEVAMEPSPEEIAKSLADQVEKWYNGGKKKRDDIIVKLREAGQEDIASDIERWFEKGNSRFFPLIERLREFKSR